LLLRYYPQLLQLNSTPDEPWIWTLLEVAPTPYRGAKLTVARLKALLTKHRIRRWTAEELHGILGTSPLPLSAGSAEAISEHALVMLPFPQRHGGRCLDESHRRIRLTGRRRRTA
jgi:hypothetical protein